MGLIFLLLLFPFAHELLVLAVLHVFVVADDFVDHGVNFVLILQGLLEFFVEVAGHQTEQNHDDDRDREEDDDGNP